MGRQCLRHSLRVTFPQPRRVLDVGEEKSHLAFRRHNHESESGAHPMIQREGRGQLKIGLPTRHGSRARAAHHPDMWQRPFRRRGSPRGQIATGARAERAPRTSMWSVPATRGTERHVRDGWHQREIRWLLATACPLPSIVTEESDVVLVGIRRQIDSTDCPMRSAAAGRRVASASSDQYHKSSVRHHCTSSSSPGSTPP